MRLVLRLRRRPPGEEEGRGSCPARRLDVPPNREPAGGKGKGGWRWRVPKALPSKSSLFVFHLKFYFLSAQLEIILIISRGRAGSQPLLLKRTEG